MNLPSRMASCLVVAALAGACTAGTEAGGTSSNQTVGAVEVNSFTTGDSPDPDGYLISADNGVPTRIESLGKIVIKSLRIGQHDITISDVSDNCTLEGPDTLSVSVKGADTIPLAFGVACVALTGDIAVSVTTVGDGTDPDGYMVSVDGDSRPIEVNGGFSFTDIPVGSHNVVLGNMADNCSTEEAVKVARVPPGGRAVVFFEVECQAPVP